MLTSRIDLLSYAVAGKRKPHQRLDTERAERSVDPVPMSSENAMGATGEFTNGFDAFPGQHPRFSRKAVEQPARWRDVE